ncbi:RNA polymerase sigma factor [Flavobacterium sp. FlaQc-47]|uniref:RNA polymerase sigma factor n=1 Tax=Flavobacterium sp. FlaQc-47 TaxID=3374180 RepID=UPI00375685D6
MKINQFNENETLVNSLIKGDEKAYMYLIDTHHQSLCAYANSLVKNIYTAEDIVQNTFIKVWEQRDVLKPKNSIKSFLYKLVYNEFIDIYRRSQLLYTVEKNYFESLNNIAHEDDSESINQILSAVNKQIETLPPKCRNIFILSKKEGLTNIEIAEHLEISIKTVESQMTIALASLKGSLEEKIKNFLFILFGRKKITL